MFNICELLNYLLVKLFLLFRVEVDLRALHEKPEVGHVEWCCISIPFEPRMLQGLRKGYPIARKRLEKSADQVFSLRRYIDVFREAEVPLDDLLVHLTVIAAGVSKWKCAE